MAAAMSGLYVRGRGGVAGAGTWRCGRGIVGMGGDQDGDLGGELGVK